MYRHYKHKTDPHRYLYRDGDRPLYGMPESYTSSAGWQTIEEFQSLDRIPERLRWRVKDKGFAIYWVRDDTA